MPASIMQRLLNAAGWDAGSARHKQLEDAMAGAGLALVDRAVDPAQHPTAREDFAPRDAWNELVHNDDRTSPEEYPDMCLISFDELKDYMERHTPAIRSPAATTHGVCLDCGVVDDDDHTPGCSALATGSPSPAASDDVDALTGTADDQGLFAAPGSPAALDNLEIDASGAPHSGIQAQPRDRSFEAYRSTTQRIGAAREKRLAELVEENARLVGLVEEAAARFEQIRLILVNHLDEPERSAFWKAVEGRNLMRGQSHPSTVRECKCQPLTRYTDSPHDPECPLSDAPQERLPTSAPGALIPDRSRS